MKEVKEHRFAGPFEVPPTKYYVQSPLGLVPKSGGQKTRLIFPLSYDFKDKQRSINHHTPDHLCTVKYNDLEHAIRNCIRLLENADSGPGTVVFCKTDCSNAFCLVPVLVCQCFLLYMMAIHPRTKKKLYFIDKYLPFGLSRSCEIFQRFSDALAFLAKFCITVRSIAREPALTNYLDDFLFMALCRIVCNNM